MDQSYQVNRLQISDPDVSNGEAENSASAGIIVCPEPAAVRFHDGSAHGLAHSHPMHLGRNEWLKQLRSNRIYETQTRISDADFHHPARD